MARDYKKEYANYHSRPEQIKRRAARNAARRAMRGRKELTDEKDVHHKDNNPLNNDKSNLSIVTKHYNRREPRLRVEDLRKWFGKGKKGDWVRVGTDGEIKGDCAREPGEGKPKCMPRSKAHSMSKKDRASSARRKRRADPQADRPGTGNKPIMVKTDKKESVNMNEKASHDEIMKDINDFLRNNDGSGVAGMSRRIEKKYGIGPAQARSMVKKALQKAKVLPKTGPKRMGRFPHMNEKFDVKYAKSKRGPIMVRSFDSAADAKKFLDQQKKQGMNGIISKKGVPVSMQRMKDMQKETVDLEEKNVPTNPALWAKMKAQAKAKFDVYPSAYANGWAAKKYKAAGGGWKTESVKEMKTFWDIRKENLEERKLDVRNLDDQELFKKAVAIAMDKYPKDRKRAEREIAKLERGKELLAHPTVQTALKRAPYQGK